MEDVEVENEIGKDIFWVYKSGLEGLVLFFLYGGGYFVFFWVVFMVVIISRV